MLKASPVFSRTSRAYFTQICNPYHCYLALNYPLYRSMQTGDRAHATVSYCIVHAQLHPFRVPRVCMASMSLVLVLKSSKRGGLRSPDVQAQIDATNRGTSKATTDWASEAIYSSRPPPSKVNLSLCRHSSRTVVPAGHIQK